MLEVWRFFLRSGEWMEEEEWELETPWEPCPSWTLLPFLRVPNSYSKPRLAIEAAAGLRRDWGLCGAVFVGFLALLRSREVVSMKMRWELAFMTPRQRTLFCCWTPKEHVGVGLLSSCSCRDPIAIQQLRRLTRSVRQMLRVWSNCKRAFPGHQPLGTVHGASCAPDATLPALGGCNMAFLILFGPHGPHVLRSGGVTFSQCKF